MTEVDQILSTLSPEERTAVLTILKEQAVGGVSQSLNELYAEDYEEIPVDIDTFLESPIYLGNSTNNGTAIYPYWRDAYRKIIDEDKVEIAMGGSIGCGKAAPLDSKLVGRDGYFRMGDVKVGDEVAGEDGRFHKVTSIWPQGEKQTYRITFSDNTSVVCCEDHLWNVKSRIGKKWKTRDTKWLRTYASKNWYEIPIAKAVPFEYVGKQCEMPEYLVGHLLADVCCCDTHLTDEVQARCDKEFRPIGCSAVVAYWSENQLTTNPRILDEYLTASTFQRISLLKGFCDLAGHELKHHYALHITKVSVIGSLTFLIHSLGGVVKTSPQRGYTLFEFWLPDNLCPYSYDLYKYSERPRRFITSIEPAGMQECQCITVDNPSQLYLMDNFTVTHNTTAAIYLMAYFVYKLMCLRNIRQYFGLEGNGPVCVAFLNNTIQLSKGVAYDKFMSTVSTSPWFLDRGEVRGTVNLRYKPDKNIEFVLGSSSDQIIGRDIFCLTGDTIIETSQGPQMLCDLEGRVLKVKSVDLGGNLVDSEKPCRIVKTKLVAAVRMITLQDKRTLKSTYNHRFLMADMTYKEAKDIKRGDRLFSATNPEGVSVANVNLVTYQTPIPVYDVLDVEPYHNFVINTGKELLVSHNCAIQDEVNFSKGADIHFEKNKVLETYNACFGRIKNRFTINGKCQGRIFLVSSKKTEYDFLNQYIERKMKSKEDAKNLFVADAKAFEVKPKGSYSGKMFRVAVGGSNLPSKIPEDTETTEELRHQGYEIYDVPVELRGDFELDINRFIGDHLGISVSEVIKFIPYTKVEACYKDIQNPVSHEVIKVNLADSIPIETYFKPQLVPESIYRKPIFIHIDTSGGKVDNTGISAVACMGYVSRNRYSEETGNEETTKQMLYRHIFSLGANADKHTEISFQKIVDFLWYLKFRLGWNIKAVSTDGYMGQFLRQQIASAGFPEVNYVSLDRNTDGYLALQSILAEERIALIKLELLESEMIRLERNNITGKIDHPLDGCFTIDTRVRLCGGTFKTIEQLLDDYENGRQNYVEAIDEMTFDRRKCKINKVFRTKFVDSVVLIHLSNGAFVRCTGNHKFMLADGTYEEISKIAIGSKLMSFDPNEEIRLASVDSVPHCCAVYDLEIEGIHNFPLAAGVVVHNSKDIADSLAGALYNATLHEAGLQLGSEDLVEMLIDENDSRASLASRYKQAASPVATTDEINKLVEQVKAEHSSSLFQKNAALLARRQAVIDKYMNQDYQDSLSDIDDGFLI